MRHRDGSIPLRLLLQQNDGRRDDRDESGRPAGFGQHHDGYDAAGDLDGRWQLPVSGPEVGGAEFQVVEDGVHGELQR